MELLIGAIALAALIVGAAALVIACLAFIDVKALKNSTHSIQYVNPLSDLDPIMSAPSDKDLEKQAKRAGLVALQEEDVDEDDFEDL